MKKGTAGVVTFPVVSPSLFHGGTTEVRSWADILGIHGTSVLMSHLLTGLAIIKLIILKINNV